MKSARKLAYAGICTAISLVSLILGGFVPYVSFMCWVASAIFVAIPMIIFDKHGALYSVLSALACSILAFVVTGVGNILYVLPFITFSAPFTLFKVFAETQVPLDKTAPIPVFDGVMPVVRTKNRLPKVLMWLVFFFFAELTIGLEVLIMYFTVPQTLATLAENKLLYIGIAIVNLIVPIYNVLTTGFLRLAKATAKKVIKF
ncbi:MAG: hypothetical protein RR086_03415 [Clostridia bacterium]